MGGWGRGKHSYMCFSHIKAINVCEPFFLVKIIDRPFFKSLVEAGKLTAGE